VVIKVNETTLFKLDENYIKLLKIKINQMNPNFITLVNFSKKYGNNGYVILMIYAENEHLSTLTFNIGKIIKRNLLEYFNLYIQLTIADIIKTHLYNNKELKFNIVTGKPMQADITFSEKIKSVIFMQNLAKTMVMKLSGSINLKDLASFNFYVQNKYKNKYFMETLNLAEKLLPGEMVYKI
jgi:hypothetical protein